MLELFETRMEGLGGGGGVGGRAYVGWGSRWHAPRVDLHAQNLACHFAHPKKGFFQSGNCEG